MTYRVIIENNEENFRLLNKYNFTMRSGCSIPNEYLYLTLTFQDGYLMGFLPTLSCVKFASTLSRLCNQPNEKNFFLKNCSDKDLWFKQVVNTLRFVPINQKTLPSIF